MKYDIFKLLDSNEDFDKKLVGELLTMTEQQNAKMMEVKSYRDTMHKERKQ